MAGTPKNELNKIRMEMMKRDNKEVAQDSDVEQFKYLGHVMSMDENDVPAMRRNLKRAQKT